MIKNLMLLFLLFMVSASLSAQKITIKGNVKTESGEPIPGVNIIEKGTYHGTITDTEGYFSISVSGDDAEIVVSSIGYKTQTIKVGQQTQLEIILKPDSNSDEYKDLVFEYETAGELRVIGEFIAVLF